jgi:hypothetical protein
MVLVDDGTATWTRWSPPGTGNPYSRAAVTPQKTDQYGTSSKRRVTAQLQRVGQLGRYVHFIKDAPETAAS